MNMADSLVAAFRQLATAKAHGRAGTQHAAAAKDVKDHADHFREQIKQLEQAKPRSGADHVKASEPLRVEQAAHAAEPADKTTTKTKGKREHATESSVHGHAASEGVASLIDWRGADTSLGAVISQLDRVQAQAVQDDDATTRVQPAQARGADKDALLPEPDLALSTANEQPEQRFTVTVDKADTVQAPVVKVAVREQETHFEPVQQVSTLQKIVDRMASDLPSTPVPAEPHVTEAAPPDLQKAADKPLRMLTIQLDPPDLGTVTVRMRLAGDAVEVRLTADSYDTTQLLQKERGALSDAMQSAGYSFDITAIDHSHAADASANPGQQPQPQPDHRPAPQAQGGASFETGTSGRSSSDAQSGARHSRQHHEQFADAIERKQDKPVARTGTGSAVYL